MYGGPYDDAFQSVHQTNDGGYIVAGRSTSTKLTCATNSDGYVIKLDSSGAVTW